MESYLLDIDEGTLPLMAVFGSLREIHPQVNIIYSTNSVQGTVLRVTVKQGESQDEVKCSCPCILSGETDSKQTNTTQIMKKYRMICKNINQEI